MTLLYIIKQLNIPAIVAHVNYNLRGKASLLDEELVRNTAMEYGCHYFSQSFSKVELSRGNLQNNARILRRRFFEKIAQQEGIKHILMAHHQDDQIETIVLKVLRGAGPESLSGMKPVTGLYVRPLLDVNRNEIMEFAKAHSIQWREDASNESGVYARNWLRQRFGSELDQRFPGWSSNILRLSQRAQITSELTELWMNSRKTSDESLSLEVLKPASDLLKSVLIKKWINENGFFPSEGVIESVVSLLESQAGAQVRLSEFASVWREREALRFDFSRLRQRVVPEEGKLLNEGGSLEFETPEVRLAISHGVKPDSYAERVLYLDSRDLRYPLIVRHWKDGDRIIPLGMEGSKLVSDLLTDHRISSSKKRQAIVVVNFDGTICAVIFPHRSENGQSGCISEKHKLVTESGKAVIIGVSWK